MRAIRFGKIFADHVDFASALDRNVTAAREERGGYVVTPNVDHVVLAEEDPALVDAYHEALLSLADGMPLLWWAKAMGTPLPEKVSGSDLVEPLVARAAREGLSVFFLGAKEGVGQRAADILKGRYPALDVAGVYSPPLGFERDEALLEATLDRVKDASPHVVLVALGCPKQELFMSRHWRALSPAVILGIGATLDFIAGEVTRAPKWMSEAGLEWVYRLGQEPRRMYERYLVRDRAIVGIAARTMRLPECQRVFDRPPTA